MTTPSKLARTLGLIGDARARPAIITAAGQANNNYEEGYFGGALARIKPAFSPALTAMLDSANVHQRSVASSVLASELFARDADTVAGFSTVRARLVALLRDPGPDTPGYAAQALFNFGDAEALAALSNALADPNARTGEAAAKALSSAQGGSPVLLATIGSTDAKARAAAGTGLSQVVAHGYGDAEAATKALDQALARSDLAVGKGAYVYFIQGSRPEAVGYLTDVLKSFGDKTMALIFLNCGQPQLVEAAETWAKENNFVVTKEETYAAADKVTWASRD